MNFIGKFDIIPFSGVKYSRSKFNLIAMEVELLYRDIYTYIDIQMIQLLINVKRLFIQKKKKS